MTDVPARIDFGANILFAHFGAVATSGNLPTLEELESRAKKLNRWYSSPRAYQQALRAHHPDDPYAVNLGSTWIHPGTEKSSQDVVSASDPTKSYTSRGKGKKKAASTSGPDEPFRGDRTLGKSAMFMHETIRSREAAYSVSEGAIGRTYECVKVSSKMIL